MQRYLVEADRLFLDKFDNSVEYEKGSTLIVDEERKDDLVERGLAHVVSEVIVDEDNDTEKEPDVEETIVDEETELKSNKTKKSKTKE